jgi:hypothetical protein
MLSFIQGITGNRAFVYEWHCISTCSLSASHIHFLCQQVTSLQQELTDLERQNQQLAMQLAAANAQRLEAAAETGQALSTADIGSVQHGRMSPGNWPSVSSSGPQQELTFGQLSVTATHAQQAIMDHAGDTNGSGRGSCSQPPRQWAEHVEESTEDDDSVNSRQQSPQPVPARSAEQPAPVSSWTPAGKGASEKQVLVQHTTAEGRSDANEDMRIAAFRPGQKQQDGRLEEAAMAPPTTRSQEPGAAAVVAGSGRDGGAVSAEAGSILKALVANLAAALPDQVAAEYKELCDDWEVRDGAAT